MSTATNLHNVSDKHFANDDINDQIRKLLLSTVATTIVITFGVGGVILADWTFYFETQSASIC